MVFGKAVNEDTAPLAMAMKQAELPLKLLALATVVAIPGSVVVGFLYGWGWASGLFFGSQMLRRSVWREIGERTGHVCDSCERSIL